MKLGYMRLFGGILVVGCVTMLIGMFDISQATKERLKAMLLSLQRKNIARTALTTEIIGRYIEEGTEQQFAPITDDVVAWFDQLSHESELLFNRVETVQVNRPQTHIFIQYKKEEEGPLYSGLYRIQDKKRLFGLKDKELVDFAFSSNGRHFWCEYDGTIIVGFIDHDGLARTIKMDKNIKSARFYGDYSLVLTDNQNRVLVYHMNNQNDTLTPVFINMDKLSDINVYLNKSATVAFAVKRDQRDVQVLVKKDKEWGLAQAFQRVDVDRIQFDFSGEYIWLSFDNQRYGVICAYVDTGLQLIAHINSELANVQMSISWAQDNIFTVSENGIVQKLCRVVGDQVVELDINLKGFDYAVVNRNGFFILLGNMQATDSIILYRVNDDKLLLVGNADIDYQVVNFNASGDGKTSVMEYEVHIEGPEPSTLFDVYHHVFGREDKLSRVYSGTLAQEFIALIDHVIWYEEDEKVYQRCGLRHFLPELTISQLQFIKDLYDQKDNDVIDKDLIQADLVILPWYIQNVLTKFIDTKNKKRLDKQVKASPAKKQRTK